MRIARPSESQRSGENSEVRRGKVRDYTEARGSERSTTRFVVNARVHARVIRFSSHGGADIVP